MKHEIETALASLVGEPLTFMMRYVGSDCRAGGKRRVH